MVFSIQAEHDENSVSFKLTMREQCENLALEIYKPFKAAMTLLSQKALIVTLEGLQTLAAADYFNVAIPRMHTHTHTLDDTHTH